MAVVRTECEREPATAVFRMSHAPKSSVHLYHPCTRLSGNTVGRRWDKENAAAVRVAPCCQQEQPSPPQQCEYRRSLLESSALVVGLSTDHLYISLSNILVSSDLYLLRNTTCQLWIQTENVSTEIEIIQLWITSVLRPNYRTTGATCRKTDRSLPGPSGYCTSPISNPSLLMTTNLVWCGFSVPAIQTTMMSTPRAQSYSLVTIQFYNVPIVRRDYNLQL